MRVLLLTGYFAPGGTSAAIRCVAFAKFLARRGIELDVLTYDEAALGLFARLDRDLATSVPAAVRVHRIPGGPLRRLGSRRLGTGTPAAARFKEEMKRSWLASALIPDPHVDSIPGFVRNARAVVRATNPDVLLTHGYPFSIHVAGALLKRAHRGLRWVADYGDPWSGNPVQELALPAWRRALDERLERVLVRRMDAITVTTEATKDDYARRFPDAAAKISVLPMGFDPEEFEHVVPKPRAPEERERLWLVHTGSLYPEARNTGPFVSAVSQLARDRPAVAERVRVILVGSVEQNIRHAIEASGAAALYQFVPWVPARESLAWMCAADYLLLFGNKGGMQIPGKAYQYLGAGRPVFMTLDHVSDATAEVVSAHPRSTVVPNTADRIAAALENLCTRVVPDELAPDRSASPFAWPTIAERLAEILAGDAHLGFRAPT
jgi:glycosyltransferase involved in cell wall biosynthesis